MSPSRRSQDPISDEELRAGLNQGQRWAQGELFLRFSDKVVRIVRRRARHLTASEVSDEVQEIFLGLIDHTSEIRVSIERYVVRTTVNHCASRARHWAAEARATDVIAREAALANSGPSGPPSVTRHDLALVRSYLDRDAAAREIYELMYVDGIGRPEIARRKNWRDRHARARMTELHRGLGAFLAARRPPPAGSLAARSGVAAG